MKKFKIVILILISLLLISCNISDIKDKVSSIFSKDKKDDTVTSDFSEEKKDDKISEAVEKEEVITDLNNQKLFRTLLGDNYAYVAANSNENEITEDIKVDLDNDGQKEEIAFGDSEDGLYFNYYNPTNDKFQFLLNNNMSKNPEEANYFFEDGWTRKEVSYQITPLDLDNDGIKEIIFSAYDPTDYGVALYSFIWKRISGEYRYIGNISGQTYMYFDTNRQSIVVPIGSQGLYSEYRIENNKIVELSENGKGSNNTTQMTSNYSIYENDLYGYSLEYPNKNFKIISEIKDGMTLQSYDSKASIYYYITENTSNESIKSMYEENIDFIGREIPYKKLGEDFYILSYIRDGYIEYVKVIYNKRNNTFIQLRFYYTQDYKNVMDPIVERMTKTLRYW